MKHPDAKKPAPAFAGAGFVYVAQFFLDGLQKYIVTPMAMMSAMI